MITLKTITTIELSSICNLECKYCVNRLLVKHPARKPGIMTDQIFARSLAWVKILCDKGTQKEININGNGESCLDPHILERAEAVKRIVGDIRVGFSTNGVNMTPELAIGLKNTGIDACDLSIHSPYHARRALEMLSDARMSGVVNMGAVMMSHNWAGQLEPENSVRVDFKIQCDPLIEGRGYISSEGYLSPCCYDYQLLGVYGHVNDNDLLEREIKPYELCKDCHQVIPESVLIKEAAA